MNTKCCSLRTRWMRRLSGSRPDWRNITWSWSRISRLCAAHAQRLLCLRVSRYRGLYAVFIAVSTGSFSPIRFRCFPDVGRHGSSVSYVSVWRAWQVFSCDRRVPEQMEIERRTGMVEYGKLFDHLDRTGRVFIVHRSAASEGERGGVPAPHRKSRPRSARSDQASRLGQQAGRACASRIVGCA